MQNRSKNIALAMSVVVFGSMLVVAPIARAQGVPPQPCDCAIVFMDMGKGLVGSNGNVPTLKGQDGPCTGGALITIDNGPIAADGFLIASVAANTAPVAAAYAVPIKLDAAGHTTIFAGNIGGMMGMSTTLSAAFYDATSPFGYTMSNELVMEVSSCCTTATTVPVLPEDCHPKKKVSIGDTVPFTANNLGNVVALQFLPPEDTANPYAAMTDFVATVCASGTGTATFNRDGAYLVNVVHDLGSEVFSVWVDTAFSEEEGDKNEECGTMALPAPTDDVKIVDCPPDACDNGFDKNAKKAMTGESGAGTVDDAIQAICDAYNANGMMKVCVHITGHGAPGSISLGDGQKADSGKSLGFKPGTCELTDKSKEFVNKVKGKVKSLELFGCNVGQGDLGCKLLQALADGIGTSACAYDKTVYWSCTGRSVKKGGMKVTKMPAVAGN